MPKHKTRNKAPQHLWTNIWNPGNLFKMLMLAAAAGQVTANSTTISPSTSTGLSTVPAGNVTTTVPSNSTALDVTTTSNSTALTTAIPALRVWKESPAHFKEAYNALDDGEKDIFRELYEKSPSFARDFKEQQETKRQSKSKDYIDTNNDLIFTQIVQNFMSSPRYKKDKAKLQQLSPRKIQAIFEVIMISLPDAENEFKSALKNLSPTDQAIFVSLVHMKSEEREKNGRIELVWLKDELQQRMEERKNAIKNSSSLADLEERLLLINYSEWISDLLVKGRLRKKWQNFLVKIVQAPDFNTRDNKISKAERWVGKNLLDIVTSSPEYLSDEERLLLKRYSAPNNDTQTYNSVQKDLIGSIWEQRPDQNIVKDLTESYKDVDKEVFESLNNINNSNYSTYQDEINAYNALSLQTNTSIFTSTSSTIEPTSLENPIEEKTWTEHWEENKTSISIVGVGSLLLGAVIVGVFYVRKYCSQNHKTAPSKVVNSVTYRANGVNIAINEESAAFLADEASTTNISRSRS